MKGFHRPLPFKVLAFNKIKTLNFTRKFIFTDSCVYNLQDENQSDWNKLFGIFLGLFGIHKNSFRFVWRYVERCNNIEIGAYWYLNGKRNFTLLCAIPLNTEFLFNLAFADDRVIFSVVKDVTVSNHEVFVNTKIMTKVRRECGIYFGGNRRAPHKITIIENKTL